MKVLNIYNNAIKALHYYFIYFIPFLWRIHRLRFWTQSSEWLCLRHLFLSGLGMDSFTSYRICTRSILTFWASFRYFSALTRKHLRRRTAFQTICLNSVESNYHLTKSINTVIAFASLAEYWDFLTSCDHRLEDLVWVQIMMS